MKVDDFAVEIRGWLSPADLPMALSDFDARRFALTRVERGRLKIKFSDCLPEELMASMALERMVDWETVARVARGAPRPV